ncbi:DUF1015 family protein [Nonomuraea salmonea]|uniref:DUF1015 family protein n=1 Tax=Nonomuraea salmonea TaxID=46181 RepID=UPI0031ED6B4C
MADGHHRYATYRVLQRQERATREAPAAGPWDFGLALLVDSGAYPPDLKAIHRVIPGLPPSPRPPPRPRAPGGSRTTRPCPTASPHSRRPPSPPSCWPTRTAPTCSPTPIPYSWPAPCPPTTPTAGTPSTPRSSRSSSSRWCGACTTATRTYASSTTTPKRPPTWPPARAAPRFC